MKVIVAGGRDFFPEFKHSQWLTEQLHELKATHIISGKARGADSFGEEIGRLLRLDIIEYPANWDRYGKKAGPLRNEEMAKVADACILFPGGQGTKNMRDLAEAYDVPIIEWEDEE